MYSYCSNQRHLIWYCTNSEKDIDGTAEEEEEAIDEEIEEENIDDTIPKLYRIMKDVILDGQSILHEVIGNQWIGMHKKEKI